MSAALAVKQFYRPGRRPRIPLSCDPCRSRKLKCNREEPCQNCIARDQRTACKYKGPNNTSSERQGGHENPMQKRIDDLENLVQKLIARSQELLPTPSPLPSDSPQPDSGSPMPEAESSHAGSSPGTTIIDGNRSVYRGAEDWYDVLQEINKLKNTWNEIQDPATGDNAHPIFSNAVDGASLLFGQVKQVELSEILATVPPKPEVDKLIRKFFDYENFPITVAPILHEPTFMREYNEHWNSPSQTNIIWLGLLFSILGITMLAYHQYDEPPEYEGISESLFQLYRLRTAQCLIIGDISKCLPYTLETLRFNATAELNRKDDNGRGLWIMTGVIIRVAINMGYHRDPSLLSSISILQAEYRRRVWLSVTVMDDMASFLVGFPRMMSNIYSDTKEPQNIHDWEMFDRLTILPPSRPLDEPTLATYIIVKGRLVRALGLVADLNNTPSQSSYAAVLEVDGALLEARQSFPLYMTVYDSGIRKTVLSNMQLAAMYHQGMCALHRKYIGKGRSDPQYKLSHDRCISSALALLELQTLLDPSWYTATHTRTMLTHAAMVLFLELEHDRSNTIPTTSPDRGAILEALETSCALWNVAKTTCDEAWRAYHILVDMLSRYQAIAGRSSLQPENQEALPKFPQLTQQCDSFPSLPNSESLGNAIFTLSTDMDIDWGTWDALITGTTSESGDVY